MKLISLILTKNCNLKCSFCYQRRENEHENLNMKVDVLESIIERYKNNEEYKFNLFGGEPFLNKKVINFITNNYSGLKKRFETTTNVSGTDLELFEKMLTNEMLYRISFSLDAIGGGARYSQKEELEVLEKLKKLLTLIKKNRGPEVIIRIVYGIKNYKKIFDTYKQFSKIRDRFCRGLKISTSFDSDFEMNEKHSEEILSQFEMIRKFEIQEYGEIKFDWLDDKNHFSVCDYRKMISYDFDGELSSCYHFFFEKPHYNINTIYDKECKTCRNQYCKVCIFAKKNKCTFYRKLKEKYDR